MYSLAQLTQIETSTYGILDNDYELKNPEADYQLGQNVEALTFSGSIFHLRSPLSGNRGPLDKSFFLFPVVVAKRRHACEIAKIKLKYTPNANDIN